MSIHAVPVDDLVEHEVNEDGDCVCGPKVRLVETEQGDQWIVTHQALDRRP